MQRFLRVTIILALVATVSVVAVASLLGPNHRLTVARHSARATAAASEIDQMAENLAATDGNPTASSVSWVSTTLSQAQSLTEGGSASAGSGPASVSDPGVYLVVVTGGGLFTFQGASVPSGASLPRGSVLWGAISQSTWQWLGVGVGGTSFDLSSLGTVTTDSLSGLKPMTAKQFRDRYGEGK